MRDGSPHTVNALRYLRAVVTTRCPLQCPYCHHEGVHAGCGGDLDAGVLARVVAALVPLGLHKIKLLGGEPLARRDLPELVAKVRAAAPQADLSLITAGTFPVRDLERAFEAGLDRANVTVHGFDAVAFAARGGTRMLARNRAETLDYLLATGRRPKLNYVATRDCEPDLTALLAWAAGRDCVVSVLDDLTDPAASAEAVMGLLRRVHGPWLTAGIDLDPDSLPTTHLRWRDGLVVEVKTSHLGDASPWAACRDCSHRARCREGISALRLRPDGTLCGCIDNPEVSVTSAVWSSLEDLRASIATTFERRAA